MHARALGSLGAWEESPPLYAAMHKTCLLGVLHDSLEATCPLKIDLKLIECILAHNRCSCCQIWAHWLHFMIKYRVRNCYFYSAVWGLGRSTVGLVPLFICQNPQFEPLEDTDLRPAHDINSILQKQPPKWSMYSEIACAPLYKIQNPSSIIMRPND